MQGRGGAEACWGPGKPAHLRFSLGQSSAPPGCPLVSVDVPSVARTKRSCNSSVVFPVHPATPREGCASLTPLTFTKKDTVVQTGTLPVSGHPGSQFCPPSSPTVREVPLRRSPCCFPRAQLKASAAFSWPCTRHPARPGLAGCDEPHPCPAYRPMGELTGHGYSCLTAWARSEQGSGVRRTWGMLCQRQSVG